MMLARMQRDNGAKKRQADTIDVAVGNHVRLRRLEARMSQDVLANKCGVSFQQIQKYESGVDRISISRFVRIANALGIAPEQLLVESLRDQRSAA